MGPEPYKVVVSQENGLQISRSKISGQMSGEVLLCEQQGLHLQHGGKCSRRRLLLRAAFLQQSLSTGKAAPCCSEEEIAHPAVSASCQGKPALFALEYMNIFMSFLCSSFHTEVQERGTFSLPPAVPYCSLLRGARDDLGFCSQCPGEQIKGLEM